jgi:epoxyqueuosine reductase
VVVIGVPFERVEAAVADGRPTGSFARYTAGVDYHLRLRGILEELCGREGFAADSVIHVDTGPLPERYLALKAGLGVLGRNGSVISREYGSFFNIGCLVLSDDVAVVEEGIRTCGGCLNCINSCPTGALSVSGYVVEKCVSFITQKKGVLDERERRAMGGSLFGCDVCQVVCPLNSGRYGDAPTAPLEEIINMTKADFDRVYKDNAVHWRGLGVLKRNASIVLNNIKGKGDN